MDQLRKLNRLAAIAIAPVRKSTPTKGLEDIYDLMPLDKFLIKTAMAAHRRIYPITNEYWRGTNKSGKEMSPLLTWDNKEIEMEIQYPNHDGCKLERPTTNFTINTKLQKR